MKPGWCSGGRALEIGSSGLGYDKPCSHQLIGQTTIIGCVPT